MASYHLEAKIIGRSEGRSAVACAAYRSGGLIEGADGRAHDYRRKRGVVASGIVAPDDAPAWALDRAALWNAVEARETRKNSRLSREIVVALPNELTPEQAFDLVTSWARDSFAATGVVADVAMHDPHPRPGQERNRHAHIMTTLRRFDPERPDGWSKDAARDLNDVAFLEGLRASWEIAQNLALAESGSSARVDHRSLAAQRQDALDAGDLDLAAALDRPAEPRLGLIAGALDARGVETDRGAALRQARETRGRLARALAAARAAAVEIAAALAEIAAPLNRRKPPAPLTPGQTETASQAVPDAPPDDPPDDPGEDSGPEGP